MPTFFGQSGVISALAGAAGQLKAAATEETAVGVAGGGGGIAGQRRYRCGGGRDGHDRDGQLLGDQALWSALDVQVTALVTGVVHGYDGAGRGAGAGGLDGVGVVGWGPLGAVVGGKVGAAVVGLMADSAVSGAVIALVDNVFTEFFGTEGVGHRVRGVRPASLPLRRFRKSGLRAAGGRGGVACQSRCPGRSESCCRGGGVAVPGDQPLWAAVDAQVTGLVTGLFADTTVQDAVQVQVAALVSGLLGGAVGCGSGCARSGPRWRVDGRFGGQFCGGGVDGHLGRGFLPGSGVVSAFSSAASQLALAVVTGRIWRRRWRR